MKTKSIMKPKNIIGLTVEEAKVHYPCIRVIKKDGVELRRKFDARKDRLNVAIENDKVVEVLGFF